MKDSAQSVKGQMEMGICINAEGTDEEMENR